VVFHIHIDTKCRVRTTDLEHGFGSVEVIPINKPS